MAFTWANTFVAPNAATGLNSGTVASVDEWPPGADEAYVQTTGSASATVTWTFDMSLGPGDKKGFNAWLQMRANNATGYSIDEIRLTDGTTTLWTNAAPGISVTSTSDLIYVIDIPDSAFSTDPAISGLVLELDVTNLLGSNNRLFFETVRLMKSPFTAAQEVDPPATLSGQDYAVYRAEDLGTLGAVDGEDIVVWPDASGNGRHLVRFAGTTTTYQTDTPDYVDFPSTANRFIGHWGSEVTGNHIWHVRLYPVDTTITQGVFSHANEFPGTGVPGTKNILGIDDAGSGDKFLLMSGDGSGPVHLYGSTTVTFNAWVRVTEWIQDSGNEKMWLNDTASAEVDGASGANNLLTVSVGNRESDDRPLQGRIAEFWIVDGNTITEANIDDARDEWVNGPGGTTFFQTVAATTTVTAALSTVVTRVYTQSVAAATTITAAISRKVSKSLAAESTVTPAITRKTQKTLAATSTLTPALDNPRVLKQAIDATTTITPDLSNVFTAGSDDGEAGFLFLQRLRRRFPR